ncbi:MAG: hypothetical protein KC426_05090 [Oceanospirillaceae bacterium]|nr:hypothetical protein [Oceanospirillaceae bacterium]
MNTTQRYLTALKRSNNEASDYKAALILGVSHQTVAKYKSGKIQMSDKTATAVAKDLKLDPVKVIAEIQYEQASTSDTRQVWRRILDMANAAPALAIIGLAVVLPWSEMALSIT